MLGVRKYTTVYMTWTLHGLLNSFNCQYTVDSIPIPRPKCLSLALSDHQILWNTG